MTVMITAFEHAPDRGKGFMRDMPVRWALEEVGQAYEVQLLPYRVMKDSAHLLRHPFGLIPTYEDGGLVLFESGAIVLHIAQHAAGLMPEEPAARGRAMSWLFAALNTVEPRILDRETSILMERGTDWFKERLPVLDYLIRERLGELSSRLGDAHWLDDSFSVGDLMMVTVLRRLKGSRTLAEFSNLATYVDRGEARPAFQRAFAGQLAAFTRKQAGA